MKTEKPRVRQIGKNNWICWRGDTYTGIGSTMEQAYVFWLIRQNIKW